MSEAKTAEIDLILNGQAIPCEGKMGNMTAVWIAAGSPENRNPYEWKRKEGAEFVKHVASRENTSVGRIYKAERGRSGSTWGHYQLVIAYASYLDPAFQATVQEAFKEWLKEEANPELAIERAIRKMRKLGWSDEKIEARLSSKAQRELFASSVGKCGGSLFADCTRAISIKLTGERPSEFRERLGLKSSQETRDHYDPETLAQTEMAEKAFCVLVAKRKPYGPNETIQTAVDAATAVKRMMESLR